MTSRVRIASIGLVAAATVALSACGATAMQDRSNTEPDRVVEATHVTLIQNADKIPSVATFCGSGFGFAATLSADGTRSPALIRLPELDEICKQEG